MTVRICHDAPNIMSGSQWKVNGLTHYERNKLRYKEIHYIRKKKLVEFIRRVKRRFGCKDCNIKDWRVLDFDHLRDKSFLVSRAPNYGWGMKRLKQEMRKCEIVCANCHRIRTYERYIESSSNGKTLSC